MFTHAKHSAAYSSTPFLKYYQNMIRRCILKMLLHSYKHLNKVSSPQMKLNWMLAHPIMSRCRSQVGCKSNAVNSGSTVDLSIVTLNSSLGSYHAYTHSHTRLPTLTHTYIYMCACAHAHTHTHTKYPIAYYSCSKKYFDN